MKRLFWATMLLFLVVVPVLAQEATPEATNALEEVTAMFDYDQTTAPEITIVSSEMRGDVTINDITYLSPVSAETIGAYLVVPSGDGPFPGIVYAHWYEPSAANSNRTEFLDEAVMMAEQYGVELLLVETMWSDPNWYQHGRTLDSRL